MPDICPTITAQTPEEYKLQMDKITPFAKRVHVDLTDGVFAPNPLVAVEQVWWPEGMVADLHLMLKEPQKHVKEVVKLKPSLVIVHAESEGNFIKLADKLHKHGIKVGVALLARTSTHVIKPSLSVIDHVLIFSGDLGFFGGTVDPTLLSKARQLKEWKPGLEIGWDGGVNDTNAGMLVEGGVDVLNTGGFVHNAADAEQAFRKLEQAASTD